MSEQTIEQLARERYPVKIHFDTDDELYVAEFLDLPGCHAFGATVQEAYNNAQEAMKEWIRVALEQGLSIPEPTKSQEHSGRILVRMPSSLHSMLVDRARMTGTSLNQYVVHLLSSAVVGDHVTRKVQELGVQLSRLRQEVAELTANVARPISQSTCEEERPIRVPYWGHSVRIISGGAAETTEPPEAPRFWITDAASHIAFPGTYPRAGWLNKEQ